MVEQPICLVVLACVPYLQTKRGVESWAVLLAWSSMLSIGAGEDWLILNRVIEISVFQVTLTWYGSEPGSSVTYCRFLCQTHASQVLLNGACIV